MSLKKGIDGIQPTVNRLNKKAEKELIANYKLGLNNIRAEMAQVYAKYGKAGSLTYAEMSKYGRLDGLFKEINEQLKVVTGKSARIINRTEKDVYSESYYRTAFGIESEAQVKLGYTLLNPKKIEASVQNPISGLTLNKRLARDRASVILQTRSAITQGLVRGEGYEKVSQRLKGVYEGDLKKTRKIVRTESHRNQMQGNLDSVGQAEDKGIKVVKVWQATLDDATRDSHAGLDGQKVKLDENFTFTDGPNAGDQTPGPGLSGFAEEDINCRCTIREEIVGYEPEVRGARDEGNIPQKTYLEWAQNKGV